MQPTAVLPRTSARTSQVFPVPGIWPWSLPVTVWASRGCVGRLLASLSDGEHIIQWQVSWVGLFSLQKGPFYLQVKNYPQNKPSNMIVILQDRFKLFFKEFKGIEAVFIQPQLKLLPLSTQMCNPVLRTVMRVVCKLHTFPFMLQLFEMNFK